MVCPVRKSATNSPFTIEPLKITAQTSAGNFASKGQTLCSALPCSTKAISDNRLRNLKMQKRPRDALSHLLRFESSVVLVGRSSIFSVGNILGLSQLCVGLGNFTIASLSL
jgi:hypothetical protein